MATKGGKKGQQLTLDNQVAFNSAEGCVVCEAKQIQKRLAPRRAPKRAHRVLCILNTKTRGLGKLTSQGVAATEDNKRRKAAAAPARADERFSSRNTDNAAATSFFNPRTAATIAQRMTMSEAPLEFETAADAVTPVPLSEPVGRLAKDVDFQEKRKRKVTPPAMVAFATETPEKVIRHKDKSLMS